VGTSRLARRLTTMLPAMRLAEALETARIHSVAGLTGARTAVVTTRPCRAPHHTISDVGLIGGARCRCPAKCRGRTVGCSFWMNSPNAAATSSRPCANRSRRASQTYNLPRVVDFAALAALAARVKIL
jgi:hypothetical protein